METATQKSQPQETAIVNNKDAFDLGSGAGNDPGSHLSRAWTLRRIVPIWKFLQPLTSSSLSTQESFLGSWSFSLSVKWELLFSWQP